MKFPSIAYGNIQTLKLRCGEVRWAPWLARCRFLEDTWGNKCPLCKMEGTLETPQHVLCNCPGTEPLRNKFYSLFERVPREFRKDDNAIIALLLGGEHQGR